MVGPGIFGERGAQSIVIICSDTRLLLAEADIIVIVGVGIRTTGLEHKVIGVIERETVDEHVSALVAITIKALHGGSDIASERYAAVRIVNTFAGTTRSVAAEFDTITVSGERSGAVKILLYPEMVRSVAGFPCPAFCKDHIVIGLKKIPCVIGVTPSAAADETVTDTIMHLAGKTIRVRAVVSVIIAVMMGVTIDDIVVGTMRTIIAADARESVGELMPEAELDTGVEVIGELATLDAVVGAFQLDGIIRCVHEMQTEEDPVVAGDQHSAVADIVLIAVAIQ